jgi:FtsH-binding integral membrane protein
MNPHAHPTDYPNHQQQAAARAAAQQGMNNMPDAYRGQGHDAEAQQRFMTSVFAWMTMGLGLTAVVSWFTYSTGLIVTLKPYLMYLSFATLGLVIGLSMLLHRMNSAVATAGFLLYAALNGLTFSIIFAVYTMGSIAQVFLVTTMTFGFMAVYGWTTKKDLTRMGSLMFMGLIGIIIAGIVNMFIGSTLLDFAISCIGVVVFVGLTAWDMQKLKRISANGFADGESERKMSIMGALTLYLDFINLFLSLLRLFGGRR